jgi:hypothetical protein
LERFERLTSNQKAELLDVAPTQSVNHGVDGTSLNLLQVMNEDGWTSPKNLFETRSQLRMKTLRALLEMNA